ncbi:MAG: AEC family transporter [Anaerolineae bacterium]|jgi:predicted permease
MSLAGILDVTPILMLIALGVILRLTGLINQQGALVLTRLAYHVTIPAAIFYSIAQSRLTSSMMMLPVLGVVVPLMLAGVVYLTTPRLADQPELRGVLMVGMVVLGVFAFPFFQLFFGPEGLARVAMYDVGNAVYAGTAAIWFSQRFGSRSRGFDGGRAWRKVIASPIMWAAALGVTVSALRIELGGPLQDFISRLAAANTPLAMMAVGAFLRPRAAHGPLVAQFVVTRMVFGVLLGWGAGLLLGLDGLDLIAASVASGLPAGTTALVYAGNEGLDTELAASIISVTVLVGAVVINILPLWLANLYL